MPRRWEFYETNMGSRPVSKEIDKCKLKTDERARLGALMQRAQEGRLLPKDSKPLGDGLRELILDGDRRTFRLFYSEVEDKGFVLLALKFINKKSTQGIATNPNDIETARKRLADWQTRVRRVQSGG